MRTYQFHFEGKTFNVRYFQPIDNFAIHYCLSDVLSPFELDSRLIPDSAILFKEDEEGICRGFTSSSSLFSALQSQGINLVLPNTERMMFARQR
ncbi:hypothetical protein HC928_04160 [bacterium]|nr:hypothetical protein [bacterium]